MRSNDHGSSDDTRSRSTDRVHEDSAQSAQQAGTVNAAEVVTVQHLVKRYGNVLVVNDVSFSKRVWTFSADGQKQDQRDRRPFTMAVYTVMFGFIAIRYFRWE
jgi:hypothetical protein